MHQDALRELLETVHEGKLSPSQAQDRLRHLPFEDLGFAKIDHHRSLRLGMPEVIYFAGKTPEQVAEIFARMAFRTAPSRTFPNLRGSRALYYLAMDPSFAANCQTKSKRRVLS